jgi:phosphate starvation-inducible protein PhoH and related proteins
VTRKREPKQKKKAQPMPTAYDTSDKPKATRVKAKTANQQLYIDSIRGNKITFCSGPAGTGKTKIAVSIAVEALLDEKVDKIIVTRPVIEVGARMGHLPGTGEEKLNPYLYPIYEELGHYLTQQEVKEYKNKGKIHIFPLAYMRGATLINSFIIADELQNMTMDEMIMLLTRFGTGTKMVLNGDPYQSDLRSFRQGAFVECMNKLGKVPEIGVVRLTALDVVREPIVSKIIEVLELDRPIS